ncbi:MAG: tRNA (adenosine(37)-N6)-threonylcarbamoyltransferase complex dimerization subunit type 1 TsaB [Lachnospiraceae bacterium]|jgi:tRNA threonylcarbamoyladenosine biosynthesis protein TsaB|nr:tRNA (adenosine(37)-N6)-threonylcarbamoyltransferase complex dimerization subunit type 1 TsaB [Lachnospiraceae bacterium]
MKLIALDSSGLVAGVAVLEDFNLLAEYTVNYKKTHSQTLLPMLDEIAGMTELDLKTIDAIAVAKGPGSFTGLRIGSATAKGLGLALDKPIIEVPTVDGLAYQLFGVQDTICPMMDARRGQVYTGLYHFVKAGEGYCFETILPQCAVSIEEIIEKCNEQGQKTIFLGDGVPVYAEKIKDLMRVPYEFAPAHCNRQRAAAVGALAMQYYKEGKVVDAAKHAPDYLRLSQAERERREREQAHGTN